MRIISNVIEQHAEEASFDWLLRNNAVGAAHYDLPDLAHLDDRINANLDGLRIAGEAGWEICREILPVADPGEIFTAGVLAFEALVPQRMDALLAAVEMDDALKRGLVSALGWIGFDTIAGPAQRLLAADLAFLKYIGLAAHAVHRRDPGVALAQLVADQDPLVRARALKAAGELGRLDLGPAVCSHLQEQDEKCRFYAAWSATLLGNSSGTGSLKALAAAPGAYARRACELAVRKIAPEDARQWLAQLAQQSQTLGTAIHGYGALGDPAAVAWLIEVMQTPESARAAGEAFSMIIGVDMASEDLEGEPPEGFEAGPTENPEDEDVDLDPDENLPWPAPELIARWWSENQRNFKAGTRHLCGTPVSEDFCRHILISGCQRLRAAAALELVLMTPGQPLFEARMPGFVQQRCCRLPGL